MEAEVAKNQTFKRPDPGKRPAKREIGWLRDMRLRSRLVLMVLLIVVPVLVISNAILTSQAEIRIHEDVNEQLKLKNEIVTTGTQLWLDSSKNILHLLAASDGMISMDAGRQKELLEITSQAFPYLYLIHTLDRSGMNVARSDQNPNQDYSDREYFQSALAGKPVSYQVLIGKTSNKPALAMSAPILDESSSVVGVVSVVGELDQISEELIKDQGGDGSGSWQVFIVDASNQVIAHSDPELSAQLADFSAYQPVYALRGGKQGIYEFVDGEGLSWLAYISLLENGWGVVTQAEVSAVLAPVYRFRLLSWSMTGMAILILAALAAWTMKRFVQPIRDLTETASAVAAGDLGRTVEMDRMDEVGELAAAFNTMTRQLSESITTLELRVAERTRMVQTTAEISRRLSMILDINQLVREVVDQLQQAFNYYHVHIYLFDETRDHLVMVGGTGEAGRAMLARGHKLECGKGLVGRAAQTNEPVVVRNTQFDSGWLPNPLLPDTKSEIAVPITVGAEVLGVLDVQHNVVGGLSHSDAELLQSVANQVAIAVQNSRAFARTQQRAEREILTVEISQKIQQTTTVEDALQVAVREVGRALGARRGVVELTAQSFKPKNRPLPDLVLEQQGATNGSIDETGA